MAMTAGGLAKLVEEMGELLQVVGKKLAYYYTDEHPDGAGSLRERMEEEVGDVTAITTFVTEGFGLDQSRIAERVQAKLKLYREWDADPDNHADNFQAAVSGCIDDLMTDDFSPEFIKKLEELAKKIQANQQGLAEWLASYTN